MLCNGRFFGEEMLLSHGTHPHTCLSVMYATVYTLQRDGLYQTFLAGHFPQTWKRVTSWVVRNTFSRAVRTLVKMRRAQGGAKPLGREAFCREVSRIE